MVIVLLEEFIKLNIIKDTIIKKSEKCEIKYKDCDSLNLKYANVKNGLLVFDCLFCKRH